MSQPNKMRKLYKKMDATSKTRFHYSRRMKLHASLSTWMIVYISLVLILTSLLQAYGLGGNIESKYVPLIQVFSSITVLVYSLIINNNDYSSLSEKMYSCASRINKLKMSADPHVDSNSLEKYDEISEKYQAILDLYETASIQDFRADYWRAMLEMPEDYKISAPARFKITSKIWLVYALNFMQYPFIVTVYGAIVFWLWRGFSI